MRKYVAVATAIVFLLGFAAASFAIHAEIPAETQAAVAKGQTQITLGGEVRARGEFRDNIRDFSDDAVDRDAYYDMRVRLAVEAKITPNTMAKFHIQSGNADNADNRTWGNYDSVGANGSYNYGNANAGDVRILEAWVLHQGTGLLGVPAFVKVGHMPIIVGTGMWLNHTYFGDDALLFGVDPMKEMHIVLGTVKFKEGNLALNDDGTAYVLLFNYDFDKKSSIGADVTYVDHQNSFGLSGVGVPSPAQNGVDINFWNIGVNGKFGVDIFNIYGEVNFQFGDISGLPAGANDQDFKGWAFKVGTNFDIKPVTLGLEWAWGSGDSDLADEDVKTFVTTQGNEQHYTYVYDYRTQNAAGNVRGGLQNTWYIKADAKMDFTKDFSGYLALYYLQADKARPVNMAGTLSAGTDKDIGFEIDAKFTYKIDRNLQYWVEGGYLFAGDFWQAANGREPDDAYAIRHGISVAF